ncbi:hypothetical protein GOODEAATRI_005815 [Goodea atripinnis]|uniref:Uncharacterized protein n=1 Tax=Goodea atripinnis TaxID=208336 RepID=A0ABV0MZV8_9TELE
MHSSHLLTFKKGSAELLSKNRTQALSTTVTTAFTGQEEGCLTQVQRGISQAVSLVGVSTITQQHHQLSPTYRCHHCHCRMRSEELTKVPHGSLVSPGSAPRYLPQPARHTTRTELTSPRFPQKVQVPVLFVLSRPDSTQNHFAFPYSTNPEPHRCCCFCAHVLHPRCRTPRLSVRCFPGLTSKSVP